MTIETGKIDLYNLLPQVSHSSIVLRMKATNKATENEVRYDRHKLHLSKKKTKSTKLGNYTASQMPPSAQATP